MSSMLTVPEMIKDEWVTENAKLKKENEMLKREIDKAEKERTLCYACNKEIGDLAKYVS